MAYLSLYRKYRPQTFTEILGQDHVARTLANAITEGRVAHAYLFTGPRGTGKTSTARILAKALNCEKGPTPEPCGVCNSCVAIAEGSSLDVFELDAASHSGVDETREILSGVPLATAGGRKKVYVIDEVHMLTTQSFNALLKTLEEPPEHVIFVLATTEAHKVLPTIVSRTQRFDFRRASADVIEAHLAEIAKLENIDADPEALAVIARHAEGSFRDALASLEQLGGLGAISIDDAERLLGDRSDDALFDVFDAVASGDLGAVFSGIHALVAQGADVRQLTLSALNLARSVLLLRTAPDAGSLLDASEEDKGHMAALAERLGVPALVRMLDLLGKALTEMRNAPNHRLLLEVALVRAAAPETDPSATGLQGRLERLERRIGIEGTVAAEPSGAGVPAGPHTEPAKAAPRASRKTAPSSKPGVPTESPASSAPKPAAAQAGSVGLGDVKEAWAVTLAELGKVSKRVAALLSPSRPVAFDGTTLTVEVQSNFHRDEMADATSTQMLSDAMHAALGIRPQLRFATRGAEIEPDEPAPDISDLADARTVEAADAIELVKKGLSAEVVEERSSK
ncbi:MAG: DNA polymerase III subunit gamma/tau [Actinomycetota bacterium]|nr:DNA polymerase III subunit gamma/tau [Actinomycetota bacterium]